jgi:hypothetical protein
MDGLAPPRRVSGYRPQVTNSRPPRPARSARTQPGGNPADETEAAIAWYRGSDVSFVFLWIDGFFNLHVAEFVGVEDLATLQALDKLAVFVPGDDAYLGVFADACHRFGID